MTLYAFTSCVRLVRWLFAPAVGYLTSPRFVHQNQLFYRVQFNLNLAYDVVEDSGSFSGRGNLQGLALPHRQSASYLI